MSQMRFTRSVLPFVLGCGALAGGILAGYWIGQTNLGTFLPRVLAVGTVVSFMTAIYFALRRPISTQYFVDNTAFLPFCLFICAAALGSSVSATAAWPLSPSDRIAGFMPYSDASDYYQLVLEWPAQTFDAWNSRRPLNATLNIMEFHLAGSTLLGMILVRVALAALAITAFIVALSSMAGRSAALSAGFVLLIWTWPYASSMASEVNGITISAAGYALLLVALAQNRRTLAYLGLFALVLAYAFRPYNPLMPALFAFVVMLGLATGWRKGLKTALLAAVAFTLLAVALPKAIYLAYGHPDGSINANTGSTVLGLARGTNWKEASEFVESKALGLPEREKNALMYEMAIESAKKDVGPLARAMMIGLAKAVFQSQQELGSTMGFSKLIVGSAQNSSGEFIRFVAQRPSIWITSLFAILSVVLIFRAPKTSMPVTLLGGISVIAFITIAPLLYTDGSWRVVATLYPGLALLATAIPLSIRCVQLTRVTTEAKPTQFLKTVSAPRLERYVPTALIGFVLVAMPYPALSRLFAGDAKPLADALILDVRDEVTPHWSGFNRAVVAPRELIAWSIEEGHGDLAAFLARYGKSVQQVRFEKGVYVLISKVTASMPDQPGFPSGPVFQLRIVQEE